CASPSTSGRCTCAAPPARSPAGHSRTPSCTWTNRPAASPAGRSVAHHWDCGGSRRRRDAELNPHSSPCLGRLQCSHPPSTRRPAMPLENAFYTAEMQGDYQLHSIGRFELEEGGVIEDLQLAVATYGTLNADKSNAILIPTWFSGTHATWEEVYIGPGRALDPAKYFIVVVNQIGNGLSTSPHNTDDPAIAMSKFPRVRIGDDVRAPEQLLREVSGIETLGLVPLGCAASRTDPRPRVEPSGRLPVRPEPRGGDHLRPGIRRRRLVLAHRGGCRPGSARGHLGGDGPVLRLLEDGVLAWCAR